jgi:hypothetical protein
MPILAIDGALLVHDTPTGEGQVSVLVLPMHTAALPAIAAGKAFTVTLAVLKQPFTV